jgi:hypothetical protein
MTYAERFYTDPSITDEELTPEVLEEIGRHKHKIIEAALPHYLAITKDPSDHEHGQAGQVLALELEPMTPNFVRALAAALKAKVN